MNSSYLKITLNTLATLTLIVSIYIIGYKIKREDFYLLMSFFTLSFIAFLYLQNQKLNLKYIFGIGLLARFVLFFAYPELSNDFYRFIWDGEMLNEGINPYAHTPNELISYGQFLSSEHYRTLYYGMGDLNASHYTCYPVVNQILFFIPAYFSDTLFGNLMGLKTIILLSEIGIFYLGIKILDKLNLDKTKIGFYFLNPFIIIELVGNLHFESVMIVFVLLFIYQILNKNWMSAAIFLAIAIQIKLIPLIFIPFLLKKLQLKKTIGFTAVVFLVLILTSSILLNEQLLQNMNQSLTLYFQTFQFNSSIFGLVNYFTSQSYGWNTTYLIGPILAKISFILIVLLALLKKSKSENDWLKGILFALVIYYLMATTVHPWYIALVLIISIFTEYKFGIIWSFLVMLSYSFYHQNLFEENLVLISFQYIALLTVLGYEIVKYTRLNNQKNLN